MKGGGQLRLLLWRDYLIRKRKFVTLAGILWVTGIMLCIYTVRMNIDNQDFPTCQFPARALPSAGVLPFLQSFVCSVSNECHTMDRFEEIPTYQAAKLTQLKGKLAPMFSPSVLELADAAPAVARLLASLARVADDPDFLHFSKNGLKFKDLFNDPPRVKRYVMSHMQLDDDVAQSLMMADISFQGLLNGSLDRCSAASVGQTLVVRDSAHLRVITGRMCALTQLDLQRMFADLMYELNFSKYIKMLGNMYARLSGDNRISALGDFLTALVRMTRLQNFLPVEARALLYGQGAGFSYVSLDLIKKFVELFQPTFGDTPEYQSILEFTDTAVTGVRYLNKIFGNVSNGTDDIDAGVNAPVDSLDVGLSKINKVLDNAMEMVSEKGETLDPFNVLTKLVSIIYKFLPAYKHDILFYSTLLAKLMESAHRVIDINMHIQDITYNVSLRNSEAISALKGIPPAIVGKTFDALVDPKRTQILTSKLTTPEQLFCDPGRLEAFLLVSRTEADAVKNQLCTDAWKNYVTDLIRSFGVFDVKDRINDMASLLIQETLGKDTSSQLYSIERDFQILRNFTTALISMDSGLQLGLDWGALLGVTEDDELMKVVNEKAHLGKLMLISVHGALAKEIVKQNAILQYKLMPILLNADTLVAALNEQLDTVPKYVSEGVKQVYGDVVATMVMTANDEEKTFKTLSTYCEDIFCHGGDNAAVYLRFPTGIDVDRLAQVLCNASLVIEGGLEYDSIVSKALAKISNTTHTALDEVNWTKLINNIQKLYVKLDNDYPYLFEYSTYAMDNATQSKIKEIYENAKEYWFGIRNLQRGLQLSVNLGFRMLYLMDHGMFNMTSESWMKMKFFFSKTVGPLAVIDDTIQLVTGLLTNTSYTSRLPPITADAMAVIVPTLPELIVDAVNIVIHDDTDIEPIISLMNASPPWPCAGSLSELLELTSSSKMAVVALERLLCLDSGLQDEWTDYLKDRKVSMDKTLSWNTTHYEPRLFLGASSSFNALVSAASRVRAAFQWVVRGEGEGQGGLGLMTAWKYAVDAASSPQGNEMIGKFFSKFDTVVNSIETSVNTSMSLNALWESYTKCVAGGDLGGCGAGGRALWKKALQVLSVLSLSIAEDMTMYFTEVNAPDYNLLQLVGFTKNTTLYMMYDKLPEFLGVLINSYFDYGFMSQVRRASQSRFWDCDALSAALAPAPGSPVTAADLRRAQPYICPSFIYWLSLPRDDNVLFNVVAKPQYYFYSYSVENATSNFEKSFTKGVSLANFISDIKLQNKTIDKEELGINNTKDRLTNFVDKILNYRLKQTDERYKIFSDVNKKQFTSHIYLTRVVAIVNKLGTAIDNLTVDEEFTTKANIGKDDIAKINADLTIMKNVFKRRAVDSIALHYDVLTDFLWRNDDSYTFIDAMDAMCEDLKQNHTKRIVVDEKRTKAQICAKNYRVLYGAVVNEVIGDYDDARQSLLNLVRIQSEDDETVADVFVFLNNRTELVDSIKHSIKFSYDLGLPIYLKYLQSNLQGYRVLLSFLSGGNWWEGLKTLYNGPEANKFLGFLEQGFEVSNNLLNNLDGVHLVRLVRDMRANDSDPCRNVTLSDYLPDASGALSALKQQLCTVDTVKLYAELPPMLIANQGYESSLKLSSDIDYTSLNTDIANIESNVGLIAEGPKEPQRPAWVTDDRLRQFRTDVVNILSKETLTKMTFGVLSNAVDAGTLFLNNGECVRCSQLTSWSKQLNLQLYKKQEYDSLLCHLHTMSLDDVYLTLKNDFHWDMLISELISSRNYTNLELNKSLNEFLGLVETHLLDELRAPAARLAGCLAHNVTGNNFGNASLFLQVLAHTAKLLRAEAPHVHHVAGVTDLPYLKQLFAHVAHRISVYRPLRDYLKGTLRLDIADDEVVLDIMEADLNLLAANKRTEDIEELIRLRTNKWEHICEEHDCGDIFSTIRDNLELDKIEADLPGLQSSEFWQLSFASSILSRVERVLAHAARLAGAAGAVAGAAGGAVAGGGRGGLAAALDALATVLMDDTVDSILYSLEGLSSELAPLLARRALGSDLRALAGGLRSLHQFKTYLLEHVDLDLRVAQFFPDPEAVESGLSKLGINNTNFWSLAAPRIHAGYLQMKPVLVSKDRPFHISRFMCDIDAMSQVLAPAQDVVSAEEVAAATVEQFCALDEDIAKEMIMVLMANADFTPIIAKVKDLLLSKLFAASDLTPEQGSEVLSRLPRMAAILPTLQTSLGDVMDELASEPLFEDLKDFSSVGQLMTSTDFLGNAGRLVCGAPFGGSVPRLVGSLLRSADLAAAPSRQQLAALPTEFCRDMYKEIISMDGGKIMWSFVKPLLMGKILFTPDTPQTHRIIQQANASFASMIQMTSLVHSLSSALPSLEEVSSHREGMVALQHALAGEGMAALRSQLLGDVEINVDVDALFGKFDLKSVGKLVSKASDLLHCFNLDRFVATRNETTLMHEAAALSQVNEFSAGIVFLNAEELDSSFSRVEYKIRMDIENAASTARRSAQLWTPGPEASFVEHMRYFRGFVQIQDMLDKAIIQLASNASKEHSRTKRQATDLSESSEEGSIRETELDWAVYTQQEPYPCYRQDTFQSSLYESQALLVGFFFALLFSVSSIVRFLVSDKESGNTMLMSVMGVELRWHTLSWALASLAELAGGALAATAVLCAGGVLPRTEPSLLFAVLMLYFLSVLSFCYMMSKLFWSASFAAVCSGIAYLTTFMPFVFILSMELLMGTALKLLVCLSMSSSFCYALLFLTRMEAMGRGAGWRDAGAALTDDSMSLVSAMGMVALDALLYLALGWALDQYCGIRSIRSNIINSASLPDKAGVSIVKVSKTYCPGTRRAKVALDNVSMELHRGQITTLLGHNGAGKTTLTNILTGMVRPSSGHVAVRGGGRVGACPQRDVLVECMSAREHVALYARLAGDHDPTEVDRMLSVLSLGEVCERAVSRLSGGTRRRVCVALAFVARPALVSLDEPTAGVDPAARREIWDMIVKLKEERTILLTTHHLDEAELLSDQIIIMHKGKVHTSGSPIEIKRSLGTGYRLSVQLPGGGGWGAEERSKAVAGAVRGVVRNAQVVDVGKSLEMLLPFYDEEGVNNNLLQLCSSLEQQQSELGFSSFSLDCSTLEQVFSDICLKADAPQLDPDVSSASEPPKSVPKSGSSSSVRSELVGAGGLLGGGGGGPRRGTRPQQLRALLWARYLHLLRNRWLLFMLIGLPGLFVLFSLAMSQMRPPPYEEGSLRLSARLYGDHTHYLVQNPSVHSDIDPRFAEQVMALLKNDKHTQMWTEKDTPVCKCMVTHQLCEIGGNTTRPEMMVLPDVDTLNTWIVNSHDIYLEKRYGGYSSTLRNNKTNLIAWYNNKGYHAMPSYLNTLNNAILRAAAGTNGNITTYSHPLKISEEQLSKDTVYQRVADAGVCTLVLVAFSAAAAGGAVPLVGARRSKEKRLQLLAGVSPAAYWAAALLADMAIIFINMVLTAVLMRVFGLPIFVDRNNLPAICILFMLSGFACSCMVHATEKLFSSASLANMLLFTGHSFLGLGGLTALLILDLISQSDATDNARWVLHKIFLLSPQFALGDGLLEIAKNTIQAQVLYRFGMDTYKDPLTSDLIALHVFSLVTVGTALLLLNLAIEYGYFDALMTRWSGVHVVESRQPEPADVLAERKRVAASLAETHDRPLSLSTIGNINRGFVHTEGQKNSLQRSVSSRDVAACLAVSKAWRGQQRPALADLTLGIAPGQCTALLGENGAGKSTTFSLLSGELRPSRGRVYLDGRARDPRGLCRGLISYCPQSDAIDPLLTVRETLQLYCRLRGIDDEDDVIERTLEMFELGGYARVRSGALSGGNRRKLCTALAFMARTPLVLLDEPTSGMDPVSRACVARGVEAATRLRRGVLLSTHALADARRAASRVALLRRGRLAALAPLQRCLDRFGGGHVVQCTGADATRAWREVRARAPAAALRLLHARALHFLMPTHATVDGKEVVTRLSDIFRLMSALQAAGHVDDYTLNQSSLDQMFLSFSDKSQFESAVDIEPLPHSPGHEAESLDSITSL